MNAGVIIFVLKVAVSFVSVLLCASLFALYRKQYRLHGRINFVVFALTLAALLGLEVIVRLIHPTIFNDFLEQHDAKESLKIHLAFSMPAAFLLFGMLFTGLKRLRSYHVACGIVFLMLWVGTFITGVFMLPHEWPW